MKTIVRVKRVGNDRNFEYFAYITECFPVDLERGGLVEITFPSDEDEIAMIVMEPITVDERLIESGAIYVNGYVRTFYKGIFIGKPEGLDDGSCDDEQDRL